METSSTANSTMPLNSRKSVEKYEHLYQAEHLNPDRQVTGSITGNQTN
jgi:hypothetical protein